MERRIIEWSQQHVCEQDDMTYWHPECAANAWGNACEVLALLQDATDRSIDVSYTLHNETVLAGTMHVLSFSDIHREGTCSGCGELLTQQPTWVKTRWAK